MTKSFYQYLMTQRRTESDHDMANFAELVFQDTVFPKHSSDYQEISDYLETHADYSFNLSKFDDIWQSYLLG